MDDALRQEFQRRRERDQAVRKPVDANDPPRARNIAAAEVDADNARWLTAVIDEHGWPGESLVGEDGAHAAWLLAQHAPDELQETWLPLLERAVAKGEAPEWQWAYLLDRVLVQRGEPQEYGTQLVMQDGKLVSHPIRDPATLDERRRAAGMEPFAEYMKVFPSESP